jgi:hypothetical protein
VGRYYKGRAKNYFLPFSVNSLVKIKEKLKMPIKTWHDFGWVGRVTANKQLAMFSPRIFN